VFERAADACLDLPVSLIESGQLYESMFGHVPLGTTTSAWFQYILHPDYKRTWPASKRLFDLTFAALIALIALPVVAIAAVAINLRPRPRFLPADPRGRGRRRVRAAQAANPDGGCRFRPAPDEGFGDAGRSRPPGLHINEPASGLAGPQGRHEHGRPPAGLPEIVSSYERNFTYYDRRHLLKPGITGWATVRCAIRYSDQRGWKLCHDLYYLKRRSCSSTC
jgi:hypothetical protein